MLSVLYAGLHLADGSLHDRVKSCLGGVQVSRNRLSADFSFEVSGIFSEAEDIPVAEGRLAADKSERTRVDHPLLVLADVGPLHLVHKGPEA